MKRAFAILATTAILLAVATDARAGLTPRDLAGVSLLPAANAF